MDERTSHKGFASLHPLTPPSPPPPPPLQISSSRQADWLLAPQAATAAARGAVSRSPKEEICLGRQAGGGLHVPVSPHPRLADTVPADASQWAPDEVGPLRALLSFASRFRRPALSAPRPIFCLSLPRRVTVHGPRSGLALSPQSDLKVRSVRGWRGDEGWRGEEMREWEMPGGDPSKEGSPGRGPPGRGPPGRGPPGRGRVRVLPDAYQTIHHPETPIQPADFGSPTANLFPCWLARLGSAGAPPLLGGPSCISARQLPVSRGRFTWPAGRAEMPASQLHPMTRPKRQPDQTSPDITTTTTQKQEQQPPHLVSPHSTPQRRARGTPIRI
ncbi:unnamed protein product [Diplocarpon coronariae]